MSFREVENIDPCHKYLPRTLSFLVDTPEIIEWVNKLCIGYFHVRLFLSTFPLSFPLSFTFALIY